MLNTKNKSVINTNFQLKLKTINYQLKTENG